MADQPYGSTVWTSQDRPPERDWKAQGVALGAAVGAGVVGARWATTPGASGARPLDTMLRVARTAGNLAPFQILNTFRAPEILSPYASPLYQQLEAVGDVFEGSIGAEYLKEADTFEYLRKLTGLDTAELAKRGITPGLVGASDEVASRLVFQRTAKSATGSLFTEVNGKRHLLNDKVMLQQFTGENLDYAAIIDKKSSINRGVHATLQAMGFMEEGNDPKSLFKFAGKRPEGVAKRPGFIPVPALRAGFGSVDEFLQGSTLARALPAFSMERFNRLLGGFSDQVLGKTTGGMLKRLGLGLNVTSGPASSMFFRFGGKAALVGGAIIGGSQVDWVRRQFGDTGQLAASGVFAAGASYLTHKAGLGGRASLFAGVASFFGQMVLPGFDQGVVPGLATVYTRSQELRGAAVNPFNYYRRTGEGFLPGISSWQTGALLGVGVLTAAYGKMSRTQGGMPYPSLMSGRGIPQAIMDRWGGELSQYGLAPQSLGSVLKQPLDTREIFWQKMLVHKEAKQRIPASVLKQLQQEYIQGGRYTTGSIRRRLMSQYSKVFGADELATHMNGLWSASEKMFDDLQPRNAINKSLISALDRIDTKYSGKGVFSEVLRQGHGLAQQWMHAFYGADFAEEGLSNALQSKAYKAPLGRLGLLFGGTVLMQQILTGGLLGSMETRQELQDIHSGKQLIEVGKSRFWEGGGTPFEGSKTSYTRPSWYALMMNRVREKGIWGEDEDEISPIGKFLRKNFTYDLEMQNYYSRPYPLSSAAFSDVPIVGGILASGFGRLFKPPVTMHEDEWMREGPGGTEYANIYRGWRNEPAYNLGAVGKGTPGSPYSTANQLSVLTYQFRELEGLCFVGSTLVNTDRGRKPISEIVLGEKVLSLDGTYRKVIGKLTTEEHNKQLVKITAAGFKTSFICTENHWIPALKRERHLCGAAKEIQNYDLSDVQAGTLRPGDFLVVVAHAEEKSERFLDLSSFVDKEQYDDNYIYHSRTKADRVVALNLLLAGASTPKELRKTFDKAAVSWAMHQIEDSYNSILRTDRYIELNADFYEFLGWYVAEGHTENARITFTLGHTEVNIADFLEDVGLLTGCRKNKRTGKEGSSIVVRLRNFPLSRWLDENFGAGARNKHIPAWIKLLPKSLLASFMRGLLRGDGYLNQFGKHAGFKSSSADLVRDVAECLLKLGIRCSFNLNVLDLGKSLYPQGTPRGATTYSILRISPSHIERYRLVYEQALVPPVIYEKPSRGRAGFIRNNLLFIPIRSISFVDERPPIYDLTIEGLQYYVVEDIVVHNTGFGKSTLSNLLVGTDTYFTDKQQLAEAGMMTSWRMRFWEMSTGGMGFMNEALRRILPSYRSEIESYNPIVNNMPSWIPEKFKAGDPYRLVEWGEARLPGAGYEALHPELKGVNAEDYPLIYQYDILSNIAPFTNNFTKLRERLYQFRASGQMSEPEAEYMDRIDRMVKERYEVYDFDNVHDNAILMPGSSLTQRIWGSGQKAFRKVAAPLEYLSPGGLRPVQKLMGDRGPIERYEYERLYGTPYAFWDKPWRDWLRPAAASTANMMGYSGKPLWRQQADDTDAFFDQIEFYKWMRLAEQAGEQGNGKDRVRYESLAAQTRTGVNPQGSPLSIYWSLPDSERPFFNAFALAEGRDRKRILEMVPEDQQHLYRAIWSRADEGDPNLWAGASVKTDKDYLYRQFYGMSPEPMPAEDWIGWNSDVSTDDIKVKYIDEMGKDIHDYGVWESQVRGLKDQPYLEDSTRFLWESGGIERGAISSDLHRLFGTGFQSPKLHVSGGQFSSSTVSLEYDDRRDGDVYTAMREYLGGY